MKTIFKKRLQQSKAAARGARVCLVNTGNGYSAVLDDAKFVHQLFDDIPIKEHGDGVFESALETVIPYNRVQGVMEKLKAHTSVALLEWETTDKTTKLVCVLYQPQDKNTSLPETMAALGVEPWLEEAHETVEIVDLVDIAEVVKQFKENAGTIDSIGELEESDDILNDDIFK